MWNISLSTIMTSLDILTKDTSCLTNCSGRGECWNGSCVCVVQFQGGDCEDYNNTYFIAFGSVFFLLCLVAVIQLILCIRSELQRAKTHSLSAACHLSTQKTLYIMVILATFSRGLYFTLLKYIPNHWAANLLSMYYPFILSSCALCVCFWAEAFHISDKSYEYPGSLSKSLVYFLVFNAFLYTALIAQFIASAMVPEPIKLSKAFQGFFASLIFIEVILFLAYGVEVYFKVKGAFANASSSLDPRTLHLSRFGLIFQGILQILTAFFLMLSVTEAKWNEDIPLLQRNSYVIVFRIVELALVMWFPCVLWNCRSPEKLWILNPKAILRESADEECVPQATPTVQVERKEETSLLSCRRRQEPSPGPAKDTRPTSAYQSTDTRSRAGTSSNEPECWICYDKDNPDLGPLITPCTCKGDVAFVHHECLRRWMLELDDSPETIKCKVCKNTYDLKQGKVRLYQGLSSLDATLCLLAFSAMGGGPGAVYAVLQAYPSSTINIVTIGMCVLLEMTCLRYLGYTISNGYKRAKIFSLKIMGKTSTSVIMEQEAETSGSTEQSNEGKMNAEGSSQMPSEDNTTAYGGAKGQNTNHSPLREATKSFQTEEQCEVYEVNNENDVAVVSPATIERTANVTIET